MKQWSLRSSSAIAALALAVVFTLMWVSKQRMGAEVPRPSPPPGQLAPTQALSAPLASEATQRRYGGRDPVETPTEDHERTFELRFVTQTAVPIADVDVYAIDLESPGELVATSNSNGVASIVARNTELALQTKANGFADAKIAIKDDPPPSRDIILSPAGVISGRVVYADKRPMAGMKVIAWPRGTNEAALQATALKANQDSCSFISESSPDGTFVLDRLTSGLEYSIAGGSDGYALALSKSVCPSSGLELIALPVYWGTLHVIDEDGQTLKSHSDLEFSLETSITATPETKSAKNIGVGVAAVLAGISKDFVRKEFCTTRWAFVCDTDWTTLGVQCRVRIPGYVPQDLRLELPRVSSEIPAYEVRMKRSGAGFGQLAIVFVRDSPSAAPDNAPRGVLVLESPGKERLTFRIDPGDQHTITLDVPSGVYTCRFKAIAGDFAYPPRHVLAETVQVGPEVGVFMVRYPATGSLEIRLPQTDGCEWVTNINIELAGTIVQAVNEAPKLPHARTVFVPGPPFVIRGLVPGLYSVVVYHTPAADGLHEVSIEADQVTVLSAGNAR